MDADEKLSPGSRKKYKSDIKAVLAVTKLDSFHAVIKKHKASSTKLMQATKANGDAYSINSKKGWGQVLLFVLDRYIRDHLPLSGRHKLTKKAFEVAHSSFVSLFHELKELSGNEKKQKQAEESTGKIAFPEYLRRIKEAYGQDSKEFLVASLYSVLTVRDNYGKMVLIGFEKQNDKKGNFLIVNPSKFELILNSYKTNKKGTESIRFKLGASKEHKALKLLVRAWIKKMKLKSGDMIWGGKGKGSPLSPLVGAMNKRVGVPGSINSLRQMKVSEIGPDAPFAQREKLAKTMSHSVFTQPHYQVKLGPRTKTV